MILRLTVPGTSDYVEVIVDQKDVDGVLTGEETAIHTYGLLMQAALSQISKFKGENA